MKLSFILAALPSLCHALSSDKEFSFGVAAPSPRLTEAEGLAESTPSSSGSRKLLQKMTLLQTAILQKHNDLRAGVTEPCTASDMQVLEWDDALAAAAATYASKCIWAHEESKNTQMGWGENLAMETGTNSSDANVLSFVQAWYDEIKDTVWPLGGVPSATTDTANCQSPNSVTGQCQIGHYLQMIWAPTNKVGCAVNVCGTGLGGAGGVLLVCKYSPFPYQTTPYSPGAACAACPGNCVNNLCAAGTPQLCTDRISGSPILIGSARMTSCAQLFASVPAWCTDPRYEDTYNVCEESCGKCFDLAGVGTSSCVASSCAAHSDCGTCAASNCGWELMTNVCKVTSTCGSGCATQTPQCPAPTCADHLTCGACAAGACGWDPMTSTCTDTTGCLNCALTSSHCSLLATCSGFSSCSSCTGVGCAWSLASNTCMVKGFCSLNCLGAGQCAAACAAASSCSDCTDRGCGWIDATQTCTDSCSNCFVKSTQCAAAVPALPTSNAIEAEVDCGAAPAGDCSACLELNAGKYSCAFDTSTFTCKKTSMCIGRPCSYWESTCPASTLSVPGTLGPPVACEYYWSPWSACSATCGQGTTTRQPIVTMPASNNGQACPVVQSQGCNLMDCSTAGTAGTATYPPAGVDACRAQCACTKTGNGPYCCANSVQPWDGTCTTDANSDACAAVCAESSSTTGQTGAYHPAKVTTCQAACACAKAGNANYCCPDAFAGWDTKCTEDANSAPCLLECGIQAPTPTSPVTDPDSELVTQVWTCDAVNIGNCQGCTALNCAFHRVTGKCIEREACTQPTGCSFASNQCGNNYNTFYKPYPPPGVSLCNAHCACSFPGNQDYCCPSSKFGWDDKCASDARSFCFHC